MDITLEDFMQKYKNTYVFLKTNTGEILTEFIKADKILTFVEPEIGQIHVTFENARKVIKTRFPETGIYNFGTRLFGLFFRVPEKQYKCCPSNNNCLIQEVYTQQVQNITFNNIKEAFNPWYPANKYDAIEIAATRGGVALNNRFGITLSDVADWDLYYKLNCIGHITNGVVYVTYEPLKQEAIDFFGADLIWK